MRKYVVFGLVWTLMQFTVAQTEIVLSKEEAVARVLANNQSLKILEQEVFAAAADHKQTMAIWLPQLAITHTGMATTNPLMAFGSKLNQAILTPGDFDPGLLNNPGQIEDFATRIEVLQPILNTEGIYQRKSAKARREAVSQQVAYRKDYIVLEAKKAYMALQLAYKSVEVMQKAEKAALENKRIAQNRLAQGFLQRADVLAIDVRVTEVTNQLAYAESAVKNASNYLSALMNDTAFQQLRPAQQLQIDTVQLSAITVSDARSDLRALEASIEAYKHKLQADKSEFLPNLNAFGTYELHDNNAFSGGANGYMFGAQLRWNLFEGSQRIGKIQKSRAEYEKAKLELDRYRNDSRVELNRVYRMVLDAQNDVRLSALAAEQSEEVLRVRANRFREGLENTADLLLAETQFAEKQLAYYKAVFQLNYAQAYVQLLTQK